MTTPTTPEPPMLPCPVCGDLPAVERWLKPIPIRAFDVEVCCEGCADYDSHVAHGATRADAAASWNEYCRTAGD